MCVNMDWNIYISLIRYIAEYNQYHTDLIEYLRQFVPDGQKLENATPDSNLIGYFLPDNRAL